MSHHLSLLGRFLHAKVDTLLCTDDSVESTVNGRGSDACPSGKPFVRWQWKDSTGTFEPEGNADGTLVEGTKFKVEGDKKEPVEARWKSTKYDVVDVVVGSSTDICTYDDPDNDNPTQSTPDTGTVESCGPPNSEGSGSGPPFDGPGQSQSMFGLIGVLAALSLLIRRSDR